jgi:hypothetical protein
MKRRTVSMVSALCLLSSASATADVICASFKPMTAAELDRASLIKGVDKGEYETTVEWKRRLEKVFPSNKPVIAAVRVSAYDEKYDADHQVLNISTVGMTGRSMRGSTDFDTLILGMRFWSEPGYVGQSAIGGSRDISVDHYDSFLLYWPHDVNRFSENTNSISLPIDPIHAKDLRAHLSVVMVGIPAAPFVYADYNRSDPTVSEPQEGHYYERGLVITPQCAALVDNRTWIPVMMLDPTNLDRRAKAHSQ